MERTTAERGMAILAVLACLIALLLIATPFAIQMENSARRAEARLDSVTVDEEAESAFNLAALWLLQGTESRERQRAKEGKTFLATPEVDTPEEFELPPALLARLQAETGPGRIWDVRIEDEQGKVNVNSAPFTLISNLLGGTVLAADLPEGAGEIAVVDGSGLPERAGAVRVGAEVCRYEERVGNRLTGVTRERAGDPAWRSQSRRWPEGTPVVPEAAFLIASRPVRTAPHRHLPYTNLYELRRISDLGPATLDADRLGRVLSDLTCISERPTGTDFTNPQTLRNAIGGDPGSDASGGEKLTLDNPAYYGPGTVVRITDGHHVDYGIVESSDGRTVRLVNRVEQEYEPDRTVVTGLVRHPVNVNTASVDVVAACLTNLCLRNREKEGVPREVALSLARRLKAEPRKSLYDLKTVYDRAAQDGLISKSQFEALYRNALNPNDARLAFSTVPFCFRSGDACTVTATAVMHSRAGEELARRTIRRQLTVKDHESAVFSVESQEDFEGPIIATRDAKWMMTYPFNTGGQYEGANVPASRYVAHVDRGIWPSTDRGSGVGDVRLLPERLDLPDVFHFDDSWYSDGEYVSREPFLLSARDRRVAMVDETGMLPVSLSFWIKPYWGDRAKTETLFDCGEEEFRNRVALAFDPQRSELVLSLADTTFAEEAVKVRHEVTPDTFADDTWYHVTAEVKGGRPGDLTLMVDGRSVGRASPLTRLTREVRVTPARPGKEEELELPVEDTSDFPASGVVFLKGPLASVGLGYARKTKKSFVVADVSGGRLRAAPGYFRYDDLSTGPIFPAGTVVELLGYSDPLITDLKVGGAKLTADLGKHHLLKVKFSADVIYAPRSTAGGGAPGADAGDGPGGGALADGGSGGGADGGGPPAPDGPSALGGDANGKHAPTGAVPIRGIAADRTTVDLVLSRDIVSFRPDIPDEESLAAFSPRGFALLTTQGYDTSIVPGQTIGGSEVVYYEKQPNGLRIHRYRATKELPASEPYFCPADTRGEEDPPLGIKTISGQIVPGIGTTLVPLSIEVDGKAEDYYDVTKEPHLTGAWVRVDEEEMLYSYPDDWTTGDSVLLVWDSPDVVGMTMASQRGAQLALVDGVIRGTDLANPDPEPTGDDGSSGGPPDGGGGSTAEPPDSGDPPPVPDPGDLPPPPPSEDDGTATAEPPEPLPVPPSPPGEDDGGPGAEPGGGPPPPPETPPAGEDDSGPSAGGPPPVPEPDGGGEADGGPSGGPALPPLPPDSGGDVPDGGDTSGETPAPPPDEGGGDDAPSDEPPGPARGGGGTPPGTLTKGGSGRVYESGGNRFADGPGESAHAAGAVVIAGFTVAAHEGRLPGDGDRITVATPEGPKQELDLGAARLEVTGMYLDFIVDAPGPLTRAWVFPTEPPAGPVSATRSEFAGILAGTVDTRRTARILAFPSGELPIRLESNLAFCGHHGSVSPAFLDELYFTPRRNGRIFYVGEGVLAQSFYQGLVHPGVTPRPMTAGIDDAQTEIPIHGWCTSGNPDGLPVSDLPETGGVVRIDDELIVYDRLQTAVGMLTGCRRGSLGTEAAPHPFGERLTQVDGVTLAFLKEELPADGDRVALDRSPRTVFPPAGWVRIGDEVLGYTSTKDTVLLMPKAMKPATAEEEAATGPGLLRGRFGTRPDSHDMDAPVFLFPARFPDRYLERAVHPDTSSILFAREIPGALYKRISFDDYVPAFTRVHVFVRFDGTPDWDSDRIYDVSSDRVKGGDRDDFERSPKRYLFEIKKPHGENRLMVQADRIEVRIQFEYTRGAFDDTATPPPDSFKRSPWLQALRIEYAAPTCVHYSEGR